MSRRSAAVVSCALLLSVCAFRAFPAAPVGTVSAFLAPPLEASLQRIINAPPSVWRSSAAEVYRWDLFPDILIIDSASFDVQDRLFTRLAYYLEKRGFRGRLLSSSRLAGRHGWNAHDYGAAGLADFFGAAAAKSFPLNPEEVALRRLSLREGIIVASRGGYAPGRGAILGISRSSSRAERELLLAHESFHGIFFSSGEYRAFCQSLWDSLSPELKSFYEDFLDSLGYDVSAPTLVVNEFQAYLMQQPLSYAQWYFRRFLRMRNQHSPAPPVAPGQLMENARALDRFLRARFGFGAGGSLPASLGSGTR